MALLALRLGHHHHHLGLSAPRDPRRLLRRRLVVASSGAVKAPAAAAVVWFKHDLRVDDHPGLAAAVAAEPRRPVLPLYVFDRRILAGYSDTMLELLLFALEDLKMVLKSQESDLLIGLGNAEDVVLKLVNEVQAGLIFTEEEVEYRVRNVLASVESSLSNSSFLSGNPPEIVVWSASLYDYKNPRELSTSHNQFLKEKLPMNTPLVAPSLPALNIEIETGSLPTLEELKGFLKESRTSENNWVPLKGTSARSILKKTLSQINVKTGVASSGSDGGEDTTAYYAMSGRKIQNSMFTSESSTEVRGGTEITLDALAAYLKYLEGTGKASWQELHDKVRLTETRDGASFCTLFGPALQLGVISKRRVYHETIQYERDRNAGFISPFGYSTPTVTAAVDAICSMEYTSVGHEGPSVLLVHGFGASLQHFRDNIGAIADQGCQVWAITLLGFGKSEKPNINYSELLWSELLRDFIVDVVKEPVHLVGNSIGGYICSITASLWPSLARSLILLNTAGSVVPSYSFIPLSEARLLLLFLRSRAGGILKEYYPTSYDPGAATVIESIFSFNLSIPLNFLFDSFGGKILIVQGMKDPLTKSKSFVSMLREHCSKVHIRELDAGHAPHDEVPDEVQAGLIFTEEEVEYRVRNVLASVESSLSNASFLSGNPPEIVVWSASLYDYKNPRELSTSHNQFLKEKLLMNTPLAAPSLPALNIEIETGSLPTLEELKGFLKEHRTSEDNWVPLTSTSARSILKKTLSQIKDNSAE
uniref:Photolyase/cryptochrome alpha/beta domain-containing protein n=1 Tax=Oryza nivara TaxID=4536 RepID=A0A0E0IMT0_ORYNI